MKKETNLETVLKRLEILEKRVEELSSSDEILSLTKAIEFSTVSRRTFYEQILPNIPHKKLTKRILIKKSELLRWMDQEGHKESQ
jgi:hypothetical protein